MRKYIKGLKYNSVLRKTLTFFYKKYLYITTTKKEFNECNKTVETYYEFPLNKREKRKQIENILFYHKIYDMTFKGYYIFGFNNLPESEVENYIYYSVGIRYLEFLNKDAITYAKNKWESYLKFKKYYNRDILLINNLKDIESFKSFCTKHPIFIKKTIDGNRGKGIEKINSSKKDLMKLLVELLSANGAFIVEEFIEQHEDISKLHQGSVNCIRIIPFVDENGNLTIYNPVLKIGQNNSLVDNGGAGGILVAVDAKTGITISNGIDEFRHEFEYHPNSKVKLKGYQIPKWNELLRMIEEIYKDANPNGRYLGWDVACTNKGWVVVEVNAKPDFAIQQLPLKRGFRKEFEKMIKWEDIVSKERLVSIKTKKKKSIIKRMKSKIVNCILKVFKRSSYKSKIAKELYCIFLYKKLYKKNKKSITKQINIYCPNHSNRELKRCVKDMIYSKEEYGIVYSEYFMFRFAEKNHKERKKFIGSIDRHMYLNYLNQVSLYNQFKDKYETYMLYKKYFKRKMVLIESEKDFDKFNDFCNKHKVFVKKVLDSSLGKGVELIDSKNENLNTLFNRLIEENGFFIVEERIIQSNEMAKLHPESVNTIRVVPLCTKDGSVIIHYPFLKMGQNESFVDNGGAGGILAAINSDTGEVISDGIDEKMTIYKKHPNTNVKIKGFQIPDWEGVQKLANNLAKENSAARYVGWDLAHTSKGWVVVEGNGKTMFVGQQMILDHGIKDELERLIEWEKVPNKESYKKKA